MPAPRAVLTAAKSLVLATGVSFAFWGAAFVHWGETGFGDWQQFHHMWESGRVALLVHGELPFWNSHQCGGMSHWGNPQFQMLSPLWWITGLPFGTTLGHKLFIVVHTALGVWGTVVYCRRALDLARLPAYLAACTWGMSGTFVWDGAGGHATFLCFYFAPWLLLAWRESLRDWRYSAAVALLLGVTLSEAATYPPPYFLILLAFDTVAALFGGARLLALLRTALVSGALSVLVTSVRTVPVLMTVLEHPRPMEARDSMTVVELVEAWTTREHDWLTPGHPYVWAEYGAFVGWGVLVLGVVGLFLALRWRKTWHLPFGFVVFAAYAMGAAGPWFPWTLTHELPFYGSLRVPSRFLVFATFYLSLGLGVAVDRVPAWVRSAPRWVPRRLLRVPTARVVGVVIFVVAVTDIAVANVPITDRWRGAALPPVQDAPFQLTRSPQFILEFAGYPRRNLGTPFCREEVPVPVSPILWMGEGPQVRVARPPKGQVVRWTKTSQAFQATITMPSAGLVRFNQNYAPGWNSNRGVVVDDRGLLALELPAGSHHVKLAYAPRDWPWSALSSCVGVLLCLSLWRWGKPRRRRRTRA